MRPTCAALFIACILSLSTIGCLADSGAIVKGTVRSGDGGLASGIPVVAYDKNMRNETVLGEAVTDSRGAYRIQYQAARAVDLVVKAQGGGDQALAESSVIYNAGKDVTLNLTIPAQSKKLKQVPQHPSVPARPQW